MTPTKNPRQLTGNVGLYYVSYKLAKKGWNVMPTSRNAKGPDIIIYSQDGKTMYKIQVKALSKWDHVSASSKKNFLMSDFVIICTNVYSDPEIFIAKTNQVTINKHGWINKKTYLKFKDNWNIIKPKN